jgi:hypothetical protein
MDHLSTCKQHLLNMNKTLTRDWFTKNSTQRALPSTWAAGRSGHAKFPKRWVPAWGYHHWRISWHVIFQDFPLCTHILFYFSPFELTISFLMLILSRVDVIFIFICRNRRGFHHHSFFLQANICTLPLTYHSMSYIFYIHVNKC